MGMKRRRRIPQYRRTAASPAAGRGRGLPAWRRYADLLLLVVAAACVPVLPALPVAWLRIPLGLLGVLFVPGYALAAALFPRHDDLDRTERVALSSALSIVAVALLALALVSLGMGILPGPITFSLSVWILAFSLAAFWRRRLAASSVAVSAIPASGEIDAQRRTAGLWALGAAVAAYAGVVANAAGGAQAQEHATASSSPAGQLPKVVLWAHAAPAGILAARLWHARGPEAWGASPQGSVEVGRQRSKAARRNWPGGQVLVTAGLVMALAAGLFAAFQLSTNRAARTTEFYVLGQEGMAERYPRQAIEGTSIATTVGINNHEEQDRTYRVEVWVVDGGSGQSTRVATGSPVTLGPGGKHEQLMSWRMPWSGVDQEVQFLLFAGNDDRPLRNLNILVDVAQSAPGA